MSDAPELYRVVCSRCGWKHTTDQPAWVLPCGNCENTCISEIVPAPEVKKLMDFKLIKELPSETQKEITWIINDLVPEESIGIIAGKGATFKTTMVLDFAVAVATGGKALQQFPTKQAGVLFIDEESGKYMLRDRLKLLGAPAEMPLHYVCSGGFVLSLQAHSDELRSYLQANPEIKLIIVDSLRRVLTGDENDSNTIADFMRIARSITAQCHVSWLLLHHERKGGNNGAVEVDAKDAMRGSGDIFNAVDTALQTTRKAQEPAFILTQIKNRYRQELEPMNIEVRDEDGGITLVCAGAAVAEMNEVERAAHELAAWLYDQKERGEFATKELIQSLDGYSPKTCARALNNLVNGKALVRVKRGVYTKDFDGIKLALGLRNEGTGGTEGTGHPQSLVPKRPETKGLKGLDYKGTVLPVPSRDFSQTQRVVALVTIPAEFVPSLGGCSIEKGAEAELTLKEAAFLKFKGFILNSGEQTQ